MEDLTEKITQILGDPESMEMVKNIASSLGADDKKESPKSADIPPIAPEQMGMIMKVMSALKSGDNNDDNVRLLLALRPHLSDEKQKKTDNAVKILKIIHLLPLIKECGLFDML